MHTYIYMYIHKNIYIHIQRACNSYNKYSLLYVLETTIGFNWSEG